MKKILTIIGLSLIGLVAITTIILACVKTSFAEAVSLDVTPTKVTVYKDGTDNTYTLGDDSDIFNKIVSLYNVSTKESVLTALFQGAYSFDSKVTKEQKSKTTLESLCSTGTYVRMFFDSAQTLKVDDKVYKDSNDDTVSFNSLLIEVNDSDTLTEYKIYTIENLTSISSSDYRSSYNLTAISKQSKLFDYIAELELL